MDTTATFSVEGTYVLKLTADDSELSASDTVTITVNPELPYLFKVTVPLDGVDIAQRTIDGKAWLTCDGTAIKEAQPVQIVNGVAEIQVDRSAITTSALCSVGVESAAFFRTVAYDQSVADLEAGTTLPVERTGNMLDEATMTLSQMVRAIFCYINPGSDQCTAASAVLEEFTLAWLVRCVKSLIDNVERMPMVQP